jgi:hypothetical protein
MPLAASAATCYPAELDGLQLIKEDVPEDTTVRFDVVGSFLNVFVGETQPLDNGTEGVLSVEVPAGATSVTVCDTYDVTFGFPQVEEPQAPVAVNVRELFNPRFVLFGTF